MLLTVREEIEATCASQYQHISILGYHTRC